MLQACLRRCTSLSDHQLSGWGGDQRATAGAAAHAATNFSSRLLRLHAGFSNLNLL